MNEEKISKLVENIIDRKLKPILQDLSKIKTKFETLLDVEKSLQYLQDQYEDFISKTKALEEKIHKELSSIQNDVGSLRMDTIANSNSVAQFQTKINELEQYSRRECLEIRGIPETEEENTNEIVKCVGDLMDVQVDENDISTSHRLPTKKGSTSPPAIIVKFTRRDIRNDFFDAKRQLRNKTTSNLTDLGLGRHQERNIYISESLTKANRQLFNECLKARKDLSFQFIWTNYGRISMRKDKNSRAITISSEMDLKRLYFEYEGKDK